MLKQAMDYPWTMSGMQLVVFVVTEAFDAHLDCQGASFRQLIAQGTRPDTTP